jgi:exodeoxyribonuclease VII large subunit
VDELRRRAQSALRSRLTFEKEALMRLSQTLHAVGPQAVLDRGFAVVQRLDDGSVVRRVDQVKDRDALVVRVSDGEFQAEVSQSEAK